MSVPARIAFGPYLVRNVIAESDVAEVVLASAFGPDGTNRMVVLRRVQVPREDVDSLNASFLERAARYAVLHHVQIAEVKDLGTLDGRSYVATEHVRGKSLLSALAACGRMGLGFPTDVALHIISLVLEALAYAHKLKTRDGAPLGILHQDIRHSNVLLSYDGSVKVTDFEMAIGSTHSRTSRGVCIGGRQGYFSYLAPEQARGERIDARTDLFSVGIVLYELVTGRHLFSDSDEDSLLERLKGGSFDLPLARYRPDLNPELESIIRTALAPEPADRFGSAEAFLEALHSFLAAVRVVPTAQSVRELMERLFGPEEREAAEEDADT